MAFWTLDTVTRCFYLHTQMIINEWISNASELTNDDDSISTLVQASHNFLSIYQLYKNCRCMSSGDSSMWAPVSHAFRSFSLFRQKKSPRVVPDQLEHLEYRFSYTYDTMGFQQCIPKRAASTPLGIVQHWSLAVHPHPGQARLRRASRSPHSWLHYGLHGSPKTCRVSQKQPKPSQD